MPNVPAPYRDLLDAQVATLATIGPDGFPQVSEVWFLTDGDEIRISLNSSRQKIRNLQRDPRCTLFLLDLVNPYRYLEIRGNAQLAPDEDYSFADRVGAKYEADLREHDRPGDSRFIVTIAPTRINAVNMRG